MRYHNSTISPLPHFSAIEGRFARLLMDNLSLELSNQLFDTVECQCDATPAVTEVPAQYCSNSFGGLVFDFLADYDIASSELYNIPSEIREGIESAINECAETYMSENNTDDIESEEYYSYEHEWLQGIHYYYVCNLFKLENGRLELNFHINTDEYCRYNTNTLGNYTRTFHISDYLTEENMEKIIDSVFYEILSQVATW